MLTICVGFKKNKFLLARVHCKELVALISLFAKAAIPAQVGASNLAQIYVFCFGTKEKAWHWQEEDKITWHTPPFIVSRLAHSTICVIKLSRDRKRKSKKEMSRELNACSKVCRKTLQFITRRMQLQTRLFFCKTPPKHSSIFLPEPLYACIESLLCKSADGQYWCLSLWFFS